MRHADHDEHTARVAKMRVVSESTHELALKHRPVFVPALAISLVVGVLVDELSSPTLPSGTEWIALGLGCSVGLLIAYLSSLRSEIVFDAMRREVRWHHIGWPGGERGTVSFDDLTDVLIVSAEERGAERIVLRTSRGTVPLTRGYFGFHSYGQTVSAIHEWLKRQGQEFPEV